MSSTTFPQVVVVTGASAGIGEAIARKLLDGGHTVIALQRLSIKEAKNVISLQKTLNNRQKKTLEEQKAKYIKD